MTATNGQTRRSHYDTSRPLKIRYDQKIQKYANAAHAVGCRLIPCVLSYAGQIHHEIEDFVRGRRVASGNDYGVHRLHADSLRITVPCFPSLRPPFAVSLLMTTSRSSRRSPSIHTITIKILFFACMTCTSLFFFIFYFSFFHFS